MPKYASHNVVKKLYDMIRRIEVYPVGSIYMSVIDESPESKFGGTWERIENRFLLAAGSSYTAGDTGGSASKNITWNNIPKKTGSVRIGTRVTSAGATNAHKVSNASGAFSVSSSTSSSSDPIYYNSSTYYSTNTAGDKINDKIDLTLGADSPSKLDTMPPYLAVYMWKRVR